MVAHLKSIVSSALLLLASTAAPSLAAPAPAPAPVPQALDNLYHATLKFREGFFRREKSISMAIPSTTVDGTKRVGYHEFDNTAGDLYDIELVEGPYEAMCGFAHEANSGHLPEVVLGQTTYYKAPGKVEWGWPKSGPVKNVKAIWCQTVTGL